MKTQCSKKVTLVITLILMLLAFVPAAASAQTLHPITLNGAGDSDVPVLDPGVTEIADSNVLLGVRGSYENTSAQKLVNRINEIRKEAYDEGLTDEYVPIKWSEDLEYIAQIRSAEAAVLEDHDRPMGGDVFDMDVNGVSSYGEVLAWGADALGAIELWYSEKKYLLQGNDYWAGHYKIMIDPDYTHVGIGSFQAKGIWNSVSGEFTMDEEISENRTGISGDCIQLIVVRKGDFTLSLKGSDIDLGGNRTFKVKADYDGLNLVVPEIIWTSSDESVATVEDGVVTGVSVGTATITAEVASFGIGSGVTVSKTITVSDQIPKKPVITNAVKAKRYLIVDWKKPAYAAGYRVQYSLKKSMKGAKTIEVGDVNTATITGLKANKPYYVRVKAVNSAGESKWSKVKKTMLR